MWTALTIFCAALFVFANALVIYVAFRFLSLALSVDASLLREFTKLEIKTDEHLRSTPLQADKLKSFIQSRMTPTEGAFEPYNEEELFLQQQVEHLRRSGMTDEECDAFIRQAVGTDIGTPEQ